MIKNDENLNGTIFDLQDDKSPVTEAELNEQDEELEEGEQPQIDSDDRHFCGGDIELEIDIDSDDEKSEWSRVMNKNFKQTWLYFDYCTNSKNRF